MNSNKPDQDHSNRLNQEEDRSRTPADNTGFSGAGFAWDVSLLFDEEQDLFCVLNLTGEFVFLSKSWEKVLEYPLNELLHRHFGDFVFPQDLSACEEKFSAVLQGKRITNFINRYVTSKGTVIWLESRANLTSDRGFLLILAKEITDFKLIEKEIQLKNRILEERLKELNCLTEVTTILQQVHLKSSILLPQIIQVIASGFQYPEITVVKITVGDEVFTSGPFSDTPYQLSAGIHVDQVLKGSLNVFYTEDRPAFDEGPFLKEERNLIDSLALIIGQYLDRSHAYESMNTYRSLLESSPDAIATFLFDGTVLTWNHKAVELYGVTAGQITGKNIKEYYPADRLHELDYFENELSKGNSIRNYKSERIKPDGSRIVVTMILQPIRNKQGHFDRYLAISHDITENVAKDIRISEGELNLRKSEEKFRLLAENVSDVIWTMDITGKFLYVSPSVERLRGFTPEEVMTQTLAESLTPASLKEAEEVFETHVPRLLAGEKVPPQTYIFEQICKDGSGVWVEIKISSIFDHEGKFLFFLGITRDFSARKKIEDELIVKEAAIRSSISAIALADSTRKVTFVNKAFVSMWGYNEESEILGMDVDDLSGNRENTKKVLQKVFMGESIQNIGQARRKDGSLIDIQISITPVFDRNQKISHVMSSFMDITESRKLEAVERYNAERVEAQYRMSLMDENSEVEITESALKELLTLLKSDGGYVYYLEPGKQQVDKYGWYIQSLNIGNLEGLYNSEASVPLSLSSCMLEKSDFIRNDCRTQPCSGCLLGSHIEIERMLTVTLEKDGEVVLLVGVVNKSTDYLDVDRIQMKIFVEEVWKVIQRARLNDELRVTKIKAEESNRLKTSLLNNMSHELRTPLNGILGFSELLKDAVEDEQLRTMVNFINISGKRLLATLTSIMELAHLETDERVVDWKEVDLSEILESVLLKFSDTLVFKRLKLVKDIENNLKLLSDKDLIENIIYYLIDNAIKFTDVGQVTVSLKQVSVNNQPKLKFSVADTGIGISEEQLSYIFEPFRQASEGVSRSHEGNGLGLTLARKYLNLLSGYFEVESKPGAGSVFTVYFNIKNISDIEIVKSEPEVDDAPAIEPAISHPVTQDVRPRILVVEDNETNVQLIGFYLEDRFDIENALTGEAALELIQNNQFDLVLMDINLGSGISGIDVLNELRMIDSYRKIPVIAVTGYVTDNERSQVMESDFNAFLSKPFRKNELDEMIDNILIHSK